VLVLGLAVTDRVAVGLAVADLVAVGLAVAVLPGPVQVVPLSAKDAGTGLALPQPPTNPIDVDAPVPSEAFQLRLAADTRAPDCVQVALHPWLTFWPAFGKSNVNDQLVTAGPRLVMATLAVNPPAHWLCTVYVTEQPPPAAEAGGVTVAMPASATTAAATPPASSA
jgi:hypothetical protein